MKTTFKKIYTFLIFLGFDPLKTVYFLKGFPSYLRDYKRLKNQKNLNGDFPFGNLFPILFEKNDQAGTMSGHYFHQDLLVAKKVFKNNPERHIDIGSRTDGFVAHVAAFREIEVFDIRSQKSSVSNIVFKQADLMNLPKNLVNYCDSISSLHAIEHFGLGRYGDPIDYFGHIKAIDNIHKILQLNGVFYFSVPIGKQRIEFNAHRVFSIEYLIKMLRPKFDIINFSYVNDKGDLFDNVKITPEQSKNNFNCKYGCGIFELKKK